MPPGRLGKGDTHNAARQTPRHQRKPQKQHEPRLPSHPVAAVAERVGGQARLVDAVDDEHAESGADAREPVYESDVHVRRVGGGVGEGGGVDEEVEA